MDDYGLSGESIVCFAGEDWWYHHPHSKNHILKRLARSNRVLFINSLTMGLPGITNPDLLLKIRRKMKSYWRWLRRVPEGLYVMTPLSIPAYGTKPVQLLNRYLLAAQIRLAMKICGLSSPILWVAIPSAAVVVEQLPAKLILYQVSDKYDANEDSAIDPDVIRGFDHRLKELAGAVLYSGRKLYEEALEPNRFFLEQAVDFDHFAKEASHTNPAIAQIPRPVLGYFGAMDYVMDAALIEQVARQRPDWSWVFIGLRSNFMAIKAPNIHFLGSKPYSELPEYIRHFDVCVLPWRLGNKFTSYGSAIKVREYLATGKPVVMAPLYEYHDFPGIRFYRTVDEFVAAVEHAIHCDSAQDREQRQSAVRNATWDARTRQVGDLISSLLAQRSSASDSSKRRSRS